MGKISRYIERDDFRKFNRILKDRPGLIRRRPEIAHEAAKFGSVEILQILLQNGVEIEHRDRKGRIPLHHAIKFCLKRKKTGNYSKALLEDLVAPLLVKSRDLLDLRDRNGITCKNLLDQLENDSKTSDEDDYEGLGNPEVKKSINEDKDWQDRLRAEEEDDVRDAFGSGVNFATDDDHLEKLETYDEWADRVFKEFHKKRRVFKKVPIKKKETEKKDEKPANPPLFNVEDRRKSQRIKSFLSLRDKVINSEHEICSEDIPFSSSDSSLDETAIAEVIIESCTKTSDNARTALRNEIRFWHPDKFTQKYKQRFKTNDEEEIVSSVTRISQALLRYGKS